MNRVIWWLNGLKSLALGVGLVLVLAFGAWGSEPIRVGLNADLTTADAESGERRATAANELAAAQRKAEEERRTREAEIARVQAEARAKRKAEFDAAYAKYQRIMEFVERGHLGPAEHLSAWQAICGDFGVKNPGDKPGTLAWSDADGTVQLASLVMMPAGSGGTAPSPSASGATRTVDIGGGVSLELVWIAPGTYMRGSTKAEQDAAVAAGSSRFGVSRENPQHRVTLSQGFWMGKYAVTQRQYQQLMAENPARFKNAGLDAPVEMVSWHQAKEFCGKLQGRLSGDMRGLAARLPTEAEWEYACRAGTTTAFHYGNDLDATMANFDGNYPYGNGRKGEYRQKTVPVGSFRPNAFGLFDMHGNVWEWCEDWYGTYSSGAVTDPTGPSSGSSRVLRGGSWFYGARVCRSAFRDVVFDPDSRDNRLGFRVVVR